VARVKLLMQMSGGRHDGREWPGYHGEFEVDDVEADALSAAGIAQILGIDKPVSVPETPAEPEADVEPAAKPRAAQARTGPRVKPGE